MSTVIINEVSDHVDMS